MKKEKRGNRLSVIGNQLTRIQNPGSRIKSLSAVICGLVLLSALIWVFTFPAYTAGLEISVTPASPTGDWAIGIKGPGETASTTDKWTVHASSDGTEDIDVQVTSDPANWTADNIGTTDTNIFSLEETHYSKYIPTGVTPNRWQDDAASGTHPFDLEFTAPASGSESGAHTLTVTLTAKNWESPLLTWSGEGSPSTHTELDCTNAGGTVYDTGATGKFCRFTGTNVSVPSGWIQAELWQSYSSGSWGGDYCHRWYSSGNTSFQNSGSTCYTPGTRPGSSDCAQCSWMPQYWYTDECISCCRIVVTTDDCATNRNAVGCY